jgi:hypothetical protein
MAKESWASWNVGLWLNNDEPLCRMAQAHYRRAGNKRDAAREILAELNHQGVTRTPDGAKYSITAIEKAL